MAHPASPKTVLRWIMAERLRNGYNRLGLASFIYFLILFNHHVTHPLCLMDYKCVNEEGTEEP